MTQRKALQFNAPSLLSPVLHGHAASFGVSDQNAEWLHSFVDSEVTIATLYHPHQVACHATCGDKKTANMPGMNPIYQRISRNIKAILDKKGMTMEQLAFAAEIDKGNLSRILGCKVGVSIEMLIKLASVLEVDIHEFFKP